ncbi:MAG: NUDIX domain-containing protein [Myxococcales bacterium]|nr:NUDIX domain-containing protein [Myxococcales bacterium]
MAKKDAHCSYCGEAFPEGMGWPRRCGYCQQTSYKNPLPVAVGIIPVGRGFLTIRRAIEPKKGALALPGGFMDHGESWQASCVREVFEETGLVYAPEQVKLFHVESGGDGMLLVFGKLPSCKISALPDVEAYPEVSERVILYEPEELAFPLHTKVLAMLFANRRSHKKKSFSL